MSEKDDATKTRGGGRKKRVVEVDKTEKDGTIAKYSRIAKKISVKVFCFFYMSYWNEKKKLCNEYVIWCVYKGRQWLESQEVDTYFRIKGLNKGVGLIHKQCTIKYWLPTGSLATALREWDSQMYWSFREWKTVVFVTHWVKHRKRLANQQLMPLRLSWSITRNSWGEDVGRERVGVVRVIEGLVYSGMLRLRD